MGLKIAPHKKKEREGKKMIGFLEVFFDLTRFLKMECERASTKGKKRQNRKKRRERRGGKERTRTMSFLEGAQPKKKKKEKKIGNSWKH